MPVAVTGDKRVDLQACSVCEAMGIQLGGFSWGSLWLGFKVICGRTSAVMYTLLTTLLTCF